MQAAIGLLLTLAVVGHGLPTFVLQPSTTSAPSHEGTASSTVAPPHDQGTPSSNTIAPAQRRSQVDQVIVLPHEIHRDPSHPESTALLKVLSALQKDDPVLKGLLVDHNIGNKFFLIKPKAAGKVISLKNLGVLYENDTRDLKKLPLEKGVKKALNTKDVAHNIQKRSTKDAVHSRGMSLPSDAAHSRQKRFSLRNIALPLSIFHYLGFLPMRVPGLPYHEDPGLPDYTEYEPYNELAYPDPPIRSRSSRYRQYY